MNVTETIEGLERYPINLRYPRDVRDSEAKLAELPIQTPTGAQITLGDVAEVRIVDGPGMIKSENARLNGWIYVDIQDRDLGSYVSEARQVVGRAGQAATRLLTELVRAVRVHGTRQGKAVYCYSCHAGDYCPAALPQFPSRSPK